MAKKVIEHNTRSTNMETGEFQEIVKTVTVKTNSQEEFFMLFIKTMSPMFELTSGVDIKVLFRLIQMASYNNGEILLPTEKRRLLCEEFGFQNPNLSNTLDRLKKTGIIKGRRGAFDLNPLFAWKGDLKSRDKAIKKMQLDFKIQYQSTKFD